MDEIEERESEITCPYCKHERTDSWESGLDNDEDFMEDECEECGKKFCVSLSITRTYISRGLCKENNTQHNWEYFDFKKDGKRCYGRKCLTCDKYEFNKKKKEKA